MSESNIVYTMKASEFYDIIDKGKNPEKLVDNIEIHKDTNGYLGKLFSDVDGVKEFKNEYLDQLLRDITIDMQLALEEFANRTGEFHETQEGTRR